MKRKFAVAMSAVLAAGSTMPVFAEEETAFAPATYVGEFAVTADGESMVFSVKAEQFAEDSASISAAVTLPGSVLGTEEAVVYGLDDVLRVVSGDLYINVAEISGLYEELTGTSLSSVLSLVGVDQDWVEIPALDIQAAEEAAEDEFNTDSIEAELTALMENFNVESTEEGTTVTFDGPAVVAAVQAFENMYDTMAAEMLNSLSMADASQISTVFEDYILAAAEGINEVTPEVSVEDAKAQIISLVDMFVEEAMSSVEIQPLQGEDGQKLSEQLQQALDEGAQINGTVTVTDAGMTENVTVTMDGETVVLDASFDGSGLSAVVTENGTEVANVSGTFAVQEDGFGLDLTAVADGETVTMNAALTALENGMSFSVVANDGSEEVSMAASITAEEGVTVTDTEAPAATLLRDVVKNAVVLFYSAEQTPVEESSEAE